MFIKYVYQICLSNMFIKYVYQICLSNMFNMFIKYVYQICLSNIVIYISYLFDYKLESSLLIIMLL